jgi:predicted Zn-dependent protease
LALVKGGHATEAAIYLNQVLRDRPLSGLANLGLAQANVEAGDIKDATTYYQRAILGGWPEKPEENRFQAHVELVQTLKNANKPEQARAELLSLAAVLPERRDMKTQVARMLIDYGLPANAVPIYEDLLRSDKQDSSAYAGLGDAQFALGQYAAAREAYHNSLLIRPGNDAAEKAMNLCERMLALDPTTQGLSPLARYQHSQALLTNTVEAVVRCGGNQAALPEATQANVDKARKTIGHRIKSQSYNDAADGDVALAQQLWASRPATCSADAGTTDALRRIVEKLAHR